MKRWSMPRLPITALVSGLVALSFVALSGAANGERRSDQGPVPLTVPKATCGPNDHPETRLAGQGPAPPRAPRLQGFNFNPQPIGQRRGDGADLPTARVREGPSPNWGY